ncbi:MAG: hypothetical protein JM58_00650 [Peptococcaceae bacterium BICA1-8]|nr:MAG: hypothetical protein JM58_00650 [Peptococcaceae bacterium BICA1-8]
MNHLNGFIIGGENKSVEFKRDYSKTLLKTISAFANYHTGRLLVGIDDGGLILITFVENPVRKYIIDKFKLI